MLLLICFLEWLSFLSSTWYLYQSPSFHPSGRKTGLTETWKNKTTKRHVHSRLSCLSPTKLLNTGQDCQYRHTYSEGGGGSPGRPAIIHSPHQHTVGVCGLPVQTTHQTHSPSLIHSILVVRVTGGSQLVLYMTLATLKDRQIGQQAYQHNLNI